MAAGARCPDTRRRGVRRRTCAPACSLAIWTGLVVLAWLDRHGAHVGVRAEVFSLIVSGISWLVSALAGAAEITVAYLATAVSWLGGHLASLFSNTGAMFSKVWEGAKIVYNDVLKPVAQWLHDTYETVKDWMVKAFGPILKWAERVQAEIKKAYTRFVAPILKILDTTNKVLDILAKLHVPFAQTLENVVADIEHTITENYLRLLGYVNKVIDTLNGFFTLDGLLQRFVLLRTLERDAYFVWRVMQNSRSRSLSELEGAQLHRAVSTQSVPELTDSLTAYWNGNGNDVGDVVDELAGLSVAIWQGGDAGAAV